MRRRQMLYVLLSTSLAACSAATSNGTEGYIEEKPTTGRTSDVLNQGEMLAAGVSDALQAITRLRPFFLRRGDTAPTVSGRSTLEVYFDNLKLGGLESLQGIPIESIKSIRYLTSSEATLRWGSNHTGSVILLSSR